MSRKITGGGRLPVHVISDSDLQENGGLYRLESNVACWVNYDSSIDDGDEGVAAVAVYSVTDEQIQSGEFSVVGGAAQPINIRLAGGDYQIPRKGFVAIPVYPIEGSDPIEPAIPPEGVVIMHDTFSGSGVLHLRVPDTVTVPDQVWFEINSVDNSLIENGQLTFSNSRYLYRVRGPGQSQIDNLRVIVNGVSQDGFGTLTLIVGWPNSLTNNYVQCHIYFEPGFGHVSMQVNEDVVDQVFFSAPDDVLPYSIEALLSVDGAASFRVTTPGEVVNLSANVSPNYAIDGAFISLQQLDDVPHVIDEVIVYRMP